jgi:chemotaxis protein methyltransferase WspC
MNAAMLANDPRFDVWLLRETGIDPASLGRSAFERAVLERAHATPPDPALTEHDGTALDAYWQRLNASPQERLALIEAIVVPETWFFRDREAFIALGRLAHEKLAREPSRMLRVLSVPCSSGEEPYSAAMTLLDAGIAAERFTIDALDISARAIELARQAIYGRNSFRGGDLAFRERHFTATADGWMLDERLRHAVNFKQTNLFEMTVDPLARYDVVFCRNVLIYFDQEAQDRAIRLLNTQLADDGMLFVGPAETGLMMRHALASARIPLAFAFRRLRPDEQRPTAANGTSFDHATPSPRVRAAAKPPLRTPESFHRREPAAATPHRRTTSMPRTGPSVAANREPSAGHTSLDEAQRLADTGLIDEAARTAHAFLTQHGPHAGAFHLLGLIADSRGHAADAQDYYRKTLYLEPAHYEALTHLATLLDAAGDRAAAAQLLRRAQRAAAAQTQTGSTKPSRGAHV